MAAKLTLVAVGKIKEPAISGLISEFLKRLKPMCEVSIVELKDEGLQKEALKLSKYLGTNSYILDEAGKQYSSQEFAALLKKQEQPITFIIGGPEGISPELKKRANIISLSRMTLTHEMTRLFLIEQVYRAYMINSGRGYYQK